VAFEDQTAPSIVAVRSRELETGLTIPFRRIRIAHRAFVSILRNEDRYALTGGDVALTRTALRAGWSTATTRTYGFSISPEDGIAVGGTVESAPASLGSEGSASAATADLRVYVRGLARHHVVAVRGGGGVSNGDPLARRTFRLGGSSAAGSVLAFDADAFSLLRAFGANAFVGRRVALVNAEYRWPLAVPQRGFRTWPVFLHTIHGAVFGDAGHAWSQSLEPGDVKTSFGAELSADVVAGYSLRLTVSAGAAWGRDGAARQTTSAAYLRIGRSF
jgi:outer membrane protein assembly factor BamA